VVHPVGPHPLLAYHVPHGQPQTPCYRLQHLYSLYLSV
jgi:hypothetical protein